MDCCNYVQTYPGHDHFYHYQPQQQHRHQHLQQPHYFCYENMNASYGMTPISDAIEANARYASRPQATNPSDYVYNPKEARLRKAMREQSRELSRQSILSGPVSSKIENGSITPNSNTSRSGFDFLNQSISCTTSTRTGKTVSSFNSSGDVIPWFSIPYTAPGNHMKSMLSHRVTQAHQRTFQPKEVLRKQSSVAGNANAFLPPTNPCYPSDFSTHGSSMQQSSIAGTDTNITCGNGGLESNDYCGIGEFTDRQKWHPYQNGPMSYHQRMGPMTRISTRHTMTINPHGHSPWSQFCRIPLTPMGEQNTMIHDPKHMAFLQDQQERRCVFPDEISMPVIENKMNIVHRRQQSCFQSSYQEGEKLEEDSLKWETKNSEASSMRESEISLKNQLKQQKNEENSVHFDEMCSQRLKTKFKQPLPGFHQAFGSTEIGKFSRSEFFANMVGENGVSKNCISSSYRSSCNNDDFVSNSPIESTENYNSLASNSHYENDRNTTQRWHGLYVDAIDGEM